MTNELKEFYLSNNYSELTIKYDGSEWVADDGIDVGTGKSAEEAYDDLLDMAEERVVLDWQYTLNEMEEDGKR